MMKTPVRGWRYAILILGLAVLAMLVMDFNSRMGELRRLTDEKEQVSAQLTSQVATKSSLEAQIAYATSEAAVQDWAYRDGHLVRSGDIPIVPVESGEVTRIPTPTVVADQEETSNLERWLALFFGPYTP